MNDINTMIEIEPIVDIKIIKESLSRIGIANKKKKILYPSCYLYQNFEKFYIVHFKEMFTLLRQNGYNNISEQDVERKNSVIFCLENWGLIKVVNRNEIEPHNVFVFVLQHKDKFNWDICHKFNTKNIELLY